MPTKQQYLDKINALKSKKREISDEDLKNYEEIKKGIPKGTNVNKWLKEKKGDLTKMLKEIEPEFQKAYNEATEICEKKKNELIEFTQNKINELEGKIKDFKSKGKEMEGKGEDLFDLRHKKETFESSLQSLQSYQKGNYRKFSFGEAEWTIDLKEYEPFEAVSEKRKFILDRQNSYDKFAETKKIIDEDENKYQAGIMKMNDEFTRKKNVFNLLNGWQKFWAKVLPASWYDKAQDYADIKNQEAAMTEAGIEIEYFVNVYEANTKTYEGEPLPEKEVESLKQETELNPQNEKQTEIEENVAEPSNNKDMLP